MLANRPAPWSNHADSTGQWDARVLATRGWQGAVIACAIACAGDVIHVNQELSSILVMDHASGLSTSSRLYFVIELDSSFLDLLTAQLLLGRISFRVKRGTPQSTTLRCINVKYQAKGISAHCESHVRVMLARVRHSRVAAPCRGAVRQQQACCQCSNDTCRYIAECNQG
jgi:hypothetical protein